MTTITIQTTDNTLTIDYDVTFDLIELPYGAIGYRNNGSSESPEENLSLFWGFVDEALSAANISSDDYITLLNIIDNDNFYGIVDR